MVDLDELRRQGEAARRRKIEKLTITATATERTKMGNHDVGRGMEVGAKVFWSMLEPDGSAERDEPPTKEVVLRAMDIMAEPYRGADAEFDDSTHRDEPLGKMMAIAFGPWTHEDEEKDAAEEGDHWYEKIYRPFRERYNFC